MTASVIAYQTVCVSHITESEGDWGMGWFATWTHLCPPRSRRSCSWQQNCEGL